jgi:hypothetical protein
MTKTDLGWKEAVASSTFVNLKSDQEKKIDIVNWGFEALEKFGKKVVEFKSDCVAEDGEKCEKKFTTISTRLKKKLQPILEPKTAGTIVSLSILKVGDGVDTQFSWP